MTTFLATFSTIACLLFATRPGFLAAVASCVFAVGGFLWLVLAAWSGGRR